MTRTAQVLFGFGTRHSCQAWLSRLEGFMEHGVLASSDPFLTARVPAVFEYASHRLLYEKEDATVTQSSFLKEAPNDQWRVARTACL